MAYVPVPKDLSNVKIKVIFNLTKRQLVCFGIAAAVGVPIFFLTKDIVGISPAVLIMMFFMFPMFMFAMYEKLGQPLEVILKNYISVKFLNPKHRPYMTDNFYAAVKRQSCLDEEVRAILHGKKIPLGERRGHTGELVPPVKSAVSKANTIISAEMMQTKRR